MRTRNENGHRVVITGAGLITPVGTDVDATWSALLCGVNGAGPITRFDATPDFDVRFAAEVKGFDPEQFMDRKETRRTDRFAQFAMAAAQQALRHAGLDPAPDTLDRDRVGVLIGSGIGGIATFEDQTRVMILTLIPHPNL